MNTTARSRRLIQVATTLLLMGSIGLAGCSRDEPDGADATTRMVFALPIGIQSHFPATGTVSAWASVDGGARIALSVDLATDTIAGEISDVRAGQRQIEIIIEYSDTFGTVEVATVTLPVTVVADQTTTVTVDLSDYTFPNDDTDVYTNLDEVIAGSDPLDGAVLPGPGTVPDSGLWNSMQWNQANWQ